MEKKSTNSLIVKCPHCGHEYHLTEIAMPGELLGKPKKNGIIKDCLGKIIYVDWSEEPATVFEYTCDNCEKDFIVEASITLKAKPKAEEEDFSNLTSSLL